MTDYRANEAPADRHRLIVGWILTGLSSLFLLADGAGKLLAPQLMIDTTPPALQLPRDVALYRELGAMLLLFVALHLWRRSALLGAVLITGFLGGAVAVNVRAGTPPVSNALVGVYVGLVLWAGFYLRDARLRAALR